MTTVDSTRPRAATGEPGWPVLGHTFSFLKDPEALFERQYAEHGPVSWLGAMGSRWMCFLGPDASEAVFRNADHAFANGPAWSYLVGPFFDRGLMLLDFEEHHRHRRIMQQAFTADRIARYTDAMHEPVEAGLAHWQPRDGFQAYPALKELTLDVATTLFMGGASDTTPAQMRRINRAFIDCVQSATALVRFDLHVGPVGVGRWHRGMRGRRVLEDFLRHYLPQRRANPGDDLFSALLLAETDDGERFTDTDVINHMIFLLMAAHDTSTITLSTMLQYLGQHPEWQDRCRSESLAVGARPTLADHASLPSSALVMKEAMRLVTPVPVVARKTVKETEVLGVRIPADTFCFVAPVFSHTSAEVWPDPTRFDPERFAPHRREDKVHRYAWHPFGGGVHKCLGMHFGGAEVTTILHHLLHRFTWSVDPSYVVPLDHHSLPFPKDGQPIDLRLR